MLRVCRYGFDLVLSSSLIMSYVSQSLLSKVSADPFVISNDQVKDTYLMYVKLKTNQVRDKVKGKVDHLQDVSRIRSARKRRLTE